MPLAEIPLQVELSGSAVSLLKLLQNLPLRPDEMRAALRIIPAPTELILIDRAGHDLRVANIGPLVAEAFSRLLANTT